MDTNLWLRFAKLPDEAKTDTLAQALSIHPDQAKNILEAIYKNLQKQDIILKAVHMKALITKDDQAVIDKIKIEKLKKRKPKRSKLENRLKFYYFEIDKLRKENISYRKIAGYLRSDHKIKVSAESLRQIYKKLSSAMDT
ncbi:MAG: hypothetical protein QW139_02960 [Candidatus Micrarchaeaceae archaeon]